MCVKETSPLFSESIVSEIYFELASILKNRSSNFQGFTVFFRYEQKPPLNAYAGVYRRARGLKFALSLHLHPFFVYISSKGSGESMHLGRIA